MGFDDVSADISRTSTLVSAAMARAAIGAPSFHMGPSRMDDATAAYGGGRNSYEGADAIVAFISGAMSDDGVHSSHRCTSPEITFISDSEAEGRWALLDTVIDTRFDLTISGAAFYEDRYRKVDGRWLISHTGYKRTYEEVMPRASIEGLRLTASWWQTGGVSELG